MLSVKKKGFFKDMTNRSKCSIFTQKEEVEVHYTGSKVCLPVKKGLNRAVLGAGENGETRGNPVNNG